MSEGEDRNEEGIGSEESKRTVIRDGVQLTPEQARIHDKVATRLHEEEEAEEKLKAEIHSVLDTAEGYDAKLNTIKELIKKKDFKGALPVVQELGITETNHHNNLTALLTILEQSPQAKSYFPSEDLYNQYIASLKKTISVSAAILKTYGEQFGITGDITDKSILMVSDTTELEKKLDEIATVITTRGPEAFDNIMLFETLKHNGTQLDKLNELVYSNTRKTSRLDFAAHAILPVQRFPRYTLLLSDIEKKMRIYDDIFADHTKFKQYLSTEKKIKDVYSLSMKDLEEHMTEYLKKTAAPKNGDRIIAVESLSQRVNKTVREGAEERERNLAKLQKQPSTLRRTLNKSFSSFGTLGRNSSNPTSTSESPSHSKDTIKRRNTD